METTELRIGNLVKYASEGSIFEIDEIHEEGLRVHSEEENTYIELEYFEPIPLTEEWLLILGFEKGKANNNPSFLLFYDKQIKATNASSEWLALCPNNDGAGLWYLSFRQGEEIEKENFHKNDLVFLSNKLKYVHELQNIYFALTGDEIKWQH